MFSLDFTFYLFADFDDLSYAFGLVFGSFLATLGSLFVNNCSVGEPYAFEWNLGPGGWGPESTAQGGGGADTLVWAVQLTVTKHHLLIRNKQITEDCNTVTPEPQTAERYHAGCRT